MCVCVCVRERKDTARQTDRHTQTKTADTKTADTTTERQSKTQTTRD